MYGGVDVYIYIFLHRHQWEDSDELHFPVVLPTIKETLLPTG
jgi:hypothetical protein